MSSELTLCLRAYFLLHGSSDGSVTPGFQAPTQKGGHVAQDRALWPSLPTPEPGTVAGGTEHSEWQSSPWSRGGVGPLDRNSGVPLRHAPLPPTVTRSFGHTPSTGCVLASQEGWAGAQENASSLQTNSTQTASPHIPAQLCSPAFSICKVVVARGAVT